jgi:potassium/hydrogen antiporter
MASIEQILFVAALLLLLAVMASKVSARLGVPGLLVFLVIGMLAGSDGPGGIYYDNAFQAQSLGVVALAFILFAGGLETTLSRVRPIVWSAVSLATVGVLITAALFGAIAWWLLKIPWREAALIGAIVSSTDAAAVFSVMRSSGVRIKAGLQELLEVESGCNDPMAVFLTTAAIGVIQRPNEPLLGLLPRFLFEMAAGAAIGFVVGRGSVALFRRLRLESEGLYPVLSVAVVLLAYAGASEVHGNGFLAVYLAGILTGNGEFPQKETIVRFHDGIAWLMQIAMFLVLGLLVFPKQLPPIAVSGVMLSLFLVAIARPASVFLSLCLSALSVHEKLFISWVGLRGAAPIILATFPMLAGVPDANLYFHLVFFIVLTSVLMQGTAIPAVARRLSVQTSPL